MSRDEAWFERFYRRHHRPIDAYCLRRVDRDDAADAVSQVFATAWRRRDEIPDGDGDVALRWLYGVARRVLSHHWRGTRRATRLAEKAGVLRQVVPPGPEVVAVASTEHELVRRAVRGLRPTDREVLLLSAWEGLTHAEIAEVVGSTTAAVDKRVARAKVRLAERYESLTSRSDRSDPAESLLVAKPSTVRTPKGGGGQ